MLRPLSPWYLVVRDCPQVERVGGVVRGARAPAQVVRRVTARVAPPAPAAPARRPPAALQRRRRPRPRERHQTTATATQVIKDVQ